MELCIHITVCCCFQLIYHKQTLFSFQNSNFTFRGFGFVTFEGADSLARVINSHALEPMKIDDKEVS